MGLLRGLVCCGAAQGAVDAGQQLNGDGADIKAALEPAAGAKVHLHAGDAAVKPRAAQGGRPHPPMRRVACEGVGSRPRDPEFRPGHG